MSHAASGTAATPAMRKDRSIDQSGTQRLTSHPTSPYRHGARPVGVEAFMTLPEDRPTEQLAVHALSPPWRPRRETCRDLSLPMTVVGSQARHTPTRPRGPRPGSSDGCRGDPAWESRHRRCNSSLATGILAEPSIACLPFVVSFSPVGSRRAVLLGSGTDTRPSASRILKRCHLCPPCPGTIPLPVHRSPLVARP
jgi:hypothetical protein